MSYKGVGRIRKICQRKGKSRAFLYLYKFPFALHNYDPYRWATYILASLIIIIFTFKERVVYILTKYAKDTNWLGAWIKERAISPHQYVPLSRKLRSLPLPWWLRCATCSRIPRGRRQARAVDRRLECRKFRLRYSATARSSTCPACRRVGTPFSRTTTCSSVWPTRRSPLTTARPDWCCLCNSGFEKMD